MKTTVDLQPDLIQKVKLLAASKHESLKQVFERLLVAGLRAEDSRPVLPPTPIKLKGGPLSFEEIRAAIEEGRK